MIRYQIRPNEKLGETTDGTPIYGFPGIIKDGNLYEFKNAMGYKKTTVKSIEDIPKPKDAKIIRPPFSLDMFRPDVVIYFEREEYNYIWDIEQYDGAFYVMQYKYTK